MALSPSRENYVRVAVRCRGRTAQEVDHSARVVVEKVSDTKLAVDHRSRRTIFPVSAVLGPDADQATVFHRMAQPLIAAFLSGENCTLFAYGQTGTGKTYTITGNCTSIPGLAVPEDAGIIPRVLQYIFTRLPPRNANYGSDWHLVCQYVELYNEELRDLLAESPGPKGAARSTSFEEVVISSLEQALALVKGAIGRRTVASTALNAVSSRSHALFSLKLTRGTSAESDTLVSSKLNIVDLAGSENVSRTSVDRTRAREAGSINQSLLALGRVISALASRQHHIPYRESQLTRLLQDSLGGQTNTCLIATISPCAADVEETINTLDYALRAQTISNRPQNVHSVRKVLYLKDLSAQLERMQAELRCQRLKNGVYVEPDVYSALVARAESQAQAAADFQAQLSATTIQLQELRSSIEAQASRCAALSAELFAERKAHAAVALERDALAAQVHIHQSFQEQTFKATAPARAAVETMRLALKEHDEQWAQNFTAAQSTCAAALERLQEVLSANLDQGKEAKELQNFSEDAVAIETALVDCFENTKRKCRIEVARAQEVLESHIREAFNRGDLRARHIIDVAAAPLTTAEACLQQVRAEIMAAEEAHKKAVSQKDAQILQLKQQLQRAKAENSRIGLLVAQLFEASQRCSVQQQDYEIQDLTSQPDAEFAEKLCRILDAAAGSVHSSVSVLQQRSAPSTHQSAMTTPACLTELPERIDRVLDDASKSLQMETGNFSGKLLAQRDRALASAEKLRCEAAGVADHFRKSLQCSGGPPLRGHIGANLTALSSALEEIESKKRKLGKQHEQAEIAVFKQGDLSGRIPLKVSNKIDVGVRKRLSLSPQRASQKPKLEE